jgi:hypothetical protein
MSAGLTPGAASTHQKEACAREWELQQQTPASTSERRRAGGDRWATLAEAIGAPGTAGITSLKFEISREGRPQAGTSRLGGAARLAHG